jgi:hypothetical protein
MSDTYSGGMTTTIIGYTQLYPIARQLNLPSDAAVDKDGDKADLENALRFPLSHRAATIAGMNLTNAPISKRLLEAFT